MTKKKPRFGALPTLNMPKKSHAMEKPAARPARSVPLSDSSISACSSRSRSVYYKTFSELCQKMKSLKSLNEWSYKTFSDRLVIRKELEQFLLPKLEICIDNSLGFTVKMFGSFLVDDHELTVLEIPSFNAKCNTVYAC